MKNIIKKKKTVLFVVVVDHAVEGVLFPRRRRLS
jgi:hypothetical protein